MSVNSSIYMLNRDVLLDIFSFNGNMFIDRQALHTTRITSQVCRHWRNLMLDTPSLWAKLIDIDHISNCRNQKWRNELIRRSGAAPLWIRVGISSPGRSQDVLSFFCSLVSGNCHRIQKLVSLGPSWTSFKVTCSMLRFPAPQLERCEAPFGRSAAELVKKAPIAPLFDNHAPMLRTFNVRDYVVDQRAPWLRHLYSMELNHAYGVRDALAVLSATHNLQELQITDLAAGDIATSLPVVSLSQLKYLEYNGRSNQTAALLAHVEIPASCSLIIRINRFDDRRIITQQKPIIVSFIDKFARHVERSFPSHTFSDVDLDYARESHISLIYQTTLPVKRLLSISVPLRGDSDSSLLEAFLKSINLPYFASVTNLNFAANGRLNPCFGLFFRNLSSVEIISVDLRTLSHLARLQKRYASKRPSVLFPALKVINFPTRRYFFESISFINQAVAAFLLSRLREGRPITTLDILNFAPLDAAPNLETLAEVKGLKVLYRLSSVEGTFENTCGSEDPEIHVLTYVGGW